MRKFSGCLLAALGAGLAVFAAIGLFNSASSLDSRVAFLVATGAAGLVFIGMGLRHLRPKLQRAADR